MKLVALVIEIMLSVMAHLFVALGIPGVHGRSLFMMLFLLIMMILRVMMFFVMRCLVIGCLVMILRVMMFFVMRCLVIGCLVIGCLVMILMLMMLFVMRCLVMGCLVMGCLVVGSLGVRVCDTSLTIKWQMHMMLLNFVFAMRALSLDIMVELGVLVLNIMHKLLLVVEILTVDIATEVHTLRNFTSEILISLVPVIVMITAIV